jgi:hypothetical protein
MKKIFLLLCLSLLSFNLIGQGQRNGFSYQALITTPLNNNDVGINLPGVDKKVTAYRNKDICLRFTFLDSSQNVEYSEIQNTRTDDYGMVNLVIGTGSPEIGYSWDNIPWGADSKSLKVEVDYGSESQTNCENFVELSLQELTAVPYAMYAPGLIGPTGPEGPQGPAGADSSVPGPRGIQGQKGDQGESGPEGPQGAPGSKGDKGDTGAQGVSVNLKGTKATIADLPISGSAGDGWIVTTGDGGIHADGSLWFWNITDGKWDDIGAIVGPQGDQGPQGQTGSTGPQGQQGIPGNDGATGPSGNDGADGQDGAPGPKGDQGVPGNDGSDGSSAYQIWIDAGNTGTEAQFLASLVGPSGNDGADGSDGQDGATGDDGDSAYEIWISHGNTGTEQDYINSFLANVVEDTIPQLGGDLDTNGNNINFGDTDAAQFGNDANLLKIFHNGNHGLVRDVSDGNLYLQSDNNVILSSDSGVKKMVKGIAGGATELYHNDVKKFETTTGGVSIFDEAILEGSTPHLTLRRTDNANVPTLRFKGSLGTEGANIGFDGTNGSPNELIFKTHDGSTLAERFRVTTSGATVSGNLSASGNITSTGGALSGFDAVIGEKVPDGTGATMDFISPDDNGKVLSYDYNFDLTLYINDGLGEGFNCLIVQKGVGKIIFEAMPDKNVVLINRQGHNKTAGQYAVVSIINIGTDGNGDDLILIGGDTGM